MSYAPFKILLAYCAIIKKSSIYSQNHRNVNQSLGHELTCNRHSVGDLCRFGAVFEGEWGVSLEARCHSELYETVWCRQICAGNLFSAQHSTRAHHVRVCFTFALVV
ncbi:MAG: hypothetical protein BWY63_03282 [Chloroflexi bacterium ADurb.Bin360]|nr:MAG: hypothetical protein BWY63_03282 [Chloroflexi bacterium ADurb.Bin360]